MWRHMRQNLVQGLTSSKGSVLLQGPSLVLTMMLSQAELHRGPEILVVPREKTPTGAAARGNP